MTDFLTHLAARSLRADPAIRPRLAGRFEPIPAAPGLASDWIGEDEAAGAAPGLQAAPARADQRASPEQIGPPAPAPWAGPQLAHLPSSFGPASGREEGARAGDSHAVASAPAGAYPPAARRPGEPAAVEGDSIASARDSGLAAAQGIAAPAERPTPVSGASEGAALARSAPALQTVAAGRAIHPDPAAGAAAAVRPAMPPAEPKVRIEQPQRRQRTLDDLAPDRDQREPDIQITIGRIEVRAVAEARPPPATRPSSGPRVTLEDYLKSRTGGG